MEARFEMIYDSFGILLNKEEIWKNNLEKVKKYIDKNNKRPSNIDSDINVKKMGIWFASQINNYNNKKYIMKCNNIIELWEQFINDDKYKIYFNNDNLKNWIDILNKVKKYIDNNNKRPSVKNKNLEIKKMGNWISDQQYKYINKNNYFEIFYKKLWEEFIFCEKYNIYFFDNETIWITNLELVKKLLDKNKKRPSKADKDLEIKKIGIWLERQFMNYNNKLQIMKNNEILNMWENFINDNKYNIYFTDNKTNWINNLNKIKKYIDTNNEKPSQYSNDNEICKMGLWIGSQIQNYKKKIKIMKDKDILKLWEDLLNDNKYKYFFSETDNISEWKNTLEDVKKYIDSNNKKPTVYSDDKNTKYLGRWIANQKNNYKNNIKIMKEKEILNVWKNFINNPKYKDFL